MKSIAIYLLGILLFSCNKQAINNIKIDMSAKRFSYDYRDKIDSVKSFTNIFAATYRNIIFSKVNKRFLDSFAYDDFSKIQLDIFLSNTRDMYFEINLKQHPVSTAKATDLPIQFALTQGLDIFGNSLQVFPNFPIYSYDTSEALINWGKNELMTLTSATFGNKPKIFNFLDDRELVLLRRGQFLRPDSNNFHFSDVSFITSSNDFSGFGDQAEKYAATIADEDIRAKYFVSEFFRKILASDTLGPVARNMLVKYERSLKTGSRDYLTADFDQDRVKLKNDVILYKLDGLYADDILKDEKDRIKVGTLFWFFYDYRGFAIQWSLLNLAIFAAIGLLVILRKKEIIGKIVLQIGPPALILLLNGYVFKNRPPDMPITYWLVPGTLFILNWLLAKRYFPNKV